MNIYNVIEKYLIEARKFEIKKKHTDGTFVGVRMSDETCKLITAFCKKYKIPDPIEAADLHVTVCYSSTPVPKYNPNAGLKFVNRMTKKQPRAWDVFGPDKYCLVLKLTSPTLNKLHAKCLKAGMTTDYPEYKPHITFSYKLPSGFDVSKLPIFTAPIEFDSEYISGIVKDKDKSKA